MRILVVLLLLSGCADRPVDHATGEMRAIERVFAVERLDIRANRRSESFDLDGNGEPDDQLAQIIGGLFSWNSDLFAAAEWAIEAGLIEWRLELRGESMSVVLAREAIEIPVLVGEAPLRIPVRGLRIEYSAVDEERIAGRLGGVIPSQAIASALVPEVARLINARIASESSDSEVAPLLDNLDWGGNGCATADDRRVDACELAEQPYWKRTLTPDVDGGLSFSIGFAARRR